MQIEILNFLRDSEAHSQSLTRRDGDSEHLDDLQAVDRALPDCDWFEVGEDPRATRITSEKLWSDADADLQY